MLKRNSSVPLYEQLGILFKEKILSGEWANGKQLPPERELCDLYEVSRITVRQAIDMIENEGLLQRKHGIGTFVSMENKLEQQLNEIKSFQKTLIQKGVIASTRIVTCGHMLCSVQLAKVLNVDLTDQITNIKLLGYGDSYPIVFYDSFFPIHIGKEMEREASEAEKTGLAFSTLDLYRSKLLIKPTHVEQTFESITSNVQLSELLKVQEGWPIFKVTSIMYNENTPLEYREAFYRGDKYRFFIKRNFPELL
ncbi:GntR family transcriptional regulator [Heyndrickxia sp. NPDC080065]|uniref:GntR family transcriptional regulator n=1 Tax=Heyndrickxia sp. NPDC080065 TaxID=3390568 RepID=UPI003CFE4109